jgi:hypothetical protein
MHIKTARIAGLTGLVSAAGLAAALLALAAGGAAPALAATDTGGTFTVNIAKGSLVTDGVTGRSVSLSGLTFSYDTGWITAQAGGSRIALAVVGGSETGSTGTSTQTFGATGLFLGTAAAKYLNKELKTTALKPQADLGGIVTTYTITS